MKKGKRIVAASLTLLGAVAVVSYTASHKPRTGGVAGPANAWLGKSAGQVKPQRPCEFALGNELAYDLRVETRGLIHGQKLGVPGATAPVDSSLAAELHLKVLSTEEQGAVLVATYRDVEPSFRAAALGAPFLLRVAPSCQLTGFARHRATSAEDGRASQALAYELQFTHTAAGTSTTLESDNGAGHYLARVRANARSSGLVIERSVERYENLWEAQAQGKDIAPKQSRAEIVFGQGPWLEQLTAHEVLEGAGVADTDTRVEVARIEADEDALAALERDPSQYLWENLLPRVVFPRAQRPVTKRDLAAREAVKNDTIAQTIAGLVVRARSEENFAKIWPPLTTYLEARPEQTEAFVQALRSGVVPPEGRAAGWVAIGQARTPEAREALLTVMRDPEAASVNRTRAMFALVDCDDVGAPLTAEMASSAMGISSADTPEKRLFAREAALAMGMMGGLHKERDQKVREVAVAAIQPLLAAQRTADDLHPVFGAVANLGERSTLGLVEPYSRHEDPMVRVGAAKTFRRVGVNESTGFVAPWLARETDAGVKRELYVTLAKQVHDAQQPADAAVLDQAIQDLAAQPGVITRRALIQVLGVAAKSYEPARMALMAQAKKEAELRSGLYALVTQYLGANDLVAGLQGGAP